jgi:hypothetical protein
MSEHKPRRSNWSRVLVVAIIVGGILLLTSILSVAAVAITYISNASWL